MTRLRPLSAAHVVRNLRRLGFEPVRQKGSHMIFQHPDGRSTVVPFHKGEDISRGLIHAILDDIKVEAETFYAL